VTAADYSWDPATRDPALICDECGDRYDPAEGCQHDGRQLCAYCFHRCPECLAAIRDDMAGEGV
jgi:hypothetical protein